MFKLQHKLKTCLLCLAALFCVALAAQEQRPRVVVLEPRSSGDVPSRVKVAVTGAMEEFILNSKKYRVVDQANTAEILAQHEFARSGLVDDSKAKEIGKLLQADIVCVSVLDREEGEFVIKCRLVDVESGEVFASATEFMESDSTPEIRKAIQIVAMKLTGVENAREVQAREQAIRDLTERNLREQQEIERLAREKAIREEQEKAERERGQRELERRLAEATASAIRETEGREAAAEENAIRELLAEIARSPAPITADGIKAAKSAVNRLAPFFNYKQSGSTASYVNKVLAKYLDNELRQLKMGQKKRYYFLYPEIIKGKLVASSHYGYKTGAASSSDSSPVVGRTPSYHINHTRLTILNFDDSVNKDAIIALDKTIANNNFQYRTEESTIYDAEILRPTVDPGRKIKISGSLGEGIFQLDDAVRLAISQTLELYDAMNVLRRGGVKMQQKYTL